MATLPFPDPPTPSSLLDARRDLETSKENVKTLAGQIHHAEEQLKRLVEEQRSAIRLLENEKSEMERRVEHTLAYLSPIRRLPRELLQEIFLFNFVDYPCCAWVLASVCVTWRRVALSMPRLWSKIRLVTSSEAPADTVRLWLERSGSHIPLDIEIFLRHPPSASTTNRSRSARRPPTATLLLDDQIGTPPPLPLATGIIASYVSVHGGPVIPVNITNETGGPIPSLFNPERSRDSVAQPTRSRSSMHWGHVAFFYLVEQMHRWERFVFRFDKSFPSIAALKSVVGDAPLLREFEISCAEGMSTSTPHMSLDWPWLPCARPESPFQLQALQSVTLQHVPFKWSTPMLQHLQHLSLRSIPSIYINSDRILHIISRCATLETLSLHFTSVHSAVIPLSSRKLANLKSLTIGGHFNLVPILDSLTLPALESITIDIETRDPIEEILTALFIRSSHPPLAHLSISYTSAISGTGLYYGAGSSIASWNFLQHIPKVQTLHVGGTPFESLLAALTNPDDDDRWVCPRLTKLAMRACHAHSNGASKLVRLIDARNPDHGGPGAFASPFVGEAPVKLRHLEVHDCVPLGVDVIDWLRGRVEEVICTEPAYDSSFNSPRSPPFHEPYL